MYIKQIIDVNMGPIARIDIKPSFNDNGDPKPVIIVGENGSGKSTFISNIVDSFCEMAVKAFSDALHPSEHGTGYDYYKVLSGLQIRIGEKYLFSRIVFDNEVEYSFVSGDCSFEKFKEESGFEGSIPDWKTNDDRKRIQKIDKKGIEKIFSEQIFCYFGPERYEKPSWVGDAYYDDIETHLSVNSIINGRLQNSIIPKNMGKNNFRWLLDLIVDSRTDIEKNDKGIYSTHVQLNNLIAMCHARANVEKVMSSILGEDVYFGLNLRKDGGARFNIKRKTNDSIIAPTLDSLSTGQLALFNVFSTIIRYADNNDINKSIHLDQITGIVVIDEIELHLHSVHQKEILPQLVKLFPRVQFFITTHSPLFLLGMKDVFGDGGFDVYQMPVGNYIDVERFSEFSRAYLYFAETETHNKELKEAIDNAVTDRPLVITEGATDWKHLQAAYNNLSIKPEFKEIFEHLNFEIFKYEPANSPNPATNKVNMGNSALVAMCEAYSKMPQKRKMIFMADRDDEKTNKKLAVEGKPYKIWGNNVYSFVLPVPETRKETPEICIEHLYSDDEIRTEYVEDGIPRRLYLGYEFSNKGISLELNKICEKRNICGPGRISIIDGSSGEKISNLSPDDDINYALSKMVFADCVLENKPGFDKFDFNNFVSIFRIIGEIIEP